MTQSRRTIEQLLNQGTLPIEKADTAALLLDIYPSKRTWLQFFDKALLIVGGIALVLSLVFFIAYNWLYMGKMGKFALVEGALAITIALYVALSFRQRFAFIRQLLLLIASIITGSLLALFGQVYQTGADTWQLFFGWAVLILPWVIIARFPALWLLWLGLINTVTLFYIDTSLFFGIDYYYQDFWQFTVITVINFIAFYLWLICFEDKRDSGLSNLKTSNLSLSDLSLSSVTADITTNSKFNSSTTLHTAAKSSLHWSTYVVGLLSTYTITYLTISTFFDNKNILLFLVAVSLWLGWCVFMHWRFRKRTTDLLMLTYLSGSVIAIVVFILGKALLSNFDAGGFLLLGLVLIGMSSYAVVWLRKVARLKNEKNLPHTTVKGEQL
ncbi:DUF2157 domain-containing protein [Psychrobacter sp. N25K4-3-2]|uniref:DUF2157 domain-containing protein n=1 Tax=Psychrobacter sp. N25K4-3-2 TaxID=2785026 RepID=UPI00188C8A87|nr:DUF2157 domain-containing protein [Psychrobacter sp. N25K4-3-2]MBF4489904.1 DUF2157 domain-containing protein [Psychrobacter sp. N25K4-3-2]